MAHGRSPRILFDVPNPFSAKTVAPVALELQRRGAVVGVTGGNQVPGSEYELVSAYPQLARIFFPSGHASWRGWDAIVFQDQGSVWYRRSAVRMRLPHGIGEGGSEGLPYCLRLASDLELDAILCTSIAGARFLEAQAPELVMDRDLFVVGWPAIDELLEPRHDALDLLTQLGLSVERKTIVLTSHWTDSGLLPSLGPEVIRALGRLSNVNVLVTGHHCLWHRESVRKSHGAAWYEQLEDAVRSLPQARLVRTGSALPILAAADLLIGDKSSIALEFSPMGRPIVYFDSPSHHPANPHLCTLLRATSSTFRTVEELVPKVAAQIRQPDVG